ncbi:MAG: AraC family transcriptional regulator [Oleibacter sp.]|nr:AraC family transcriptional regulator [Thalassolituus sp.]
MKLGDLSVTYVDVMMRTVERLGFDSSELLKQFRIDQTTLASPDARISIPRYMRLGYAAIELTGCPWLGLEMGANTQAVHYGHTGLLAMTASSVLEACQDIADFGLLSSYNARGSVQFDASSKSPLLSFYSIDPYNDYNRFVVDSVLSGWFYVLKQMTGRSDCVEQIHIEFSAPSYAEKYKEYLPCPIKFAAQANQLLLNSSIMARPLMQSCASVHEALRLYAEREITKVRLGLSYIERVGRVISPMLVGKTPDMDEVASRLNMTPWTLRRRLEAENSSFQQVLSDTRHWLAEAYLRDTHISLGEIAYLTGFGSATAFQRAFKRWTGEAPGRYRDQYKDH